MSYMLATQIVLFSSGAWLTSVAARILTGHENFNLTALIAATILTTMVWVYPQAIPHIVVTQAMQIAATIAAFAPVALGLRDSHLREAARYF